MPYIKKLVMQGFKSFAIKTEILFEPDMNVIVGPNGSGKSNITDALCFVLGRLSIKSIRAAKAANLIFSGNKRHRPSSEAIVELVFDNSDNAFPIDSSELSIKRIVRRNGLSIYKINNHVKTRQELLELLAQAGIDPNGFNIVLQGEIASLIKLSSEGRRKILEDVAGISIYETRKQKSLHELEKTEEKLKEVSAILRERNIHMKNLEKEREEAKRYQKLEDIVKRCKGTILDRVIKEKQKEISKLDQSTEDYNKEITDLKKKINEKKSSISNLEDKIKNANKQIQESTSSEQESLHKEIAELKAEIAGLSVRKENFESRIESNKEKREKYKEKSIELEKEISQMKGASPEIKKKQEKLKSHQEKFDILEKQRKKFYMVKSEISNLESRRDEKQKSLIEYRKELELIEKHISELFDEVKSGKMIEKVEELRRKTDKEIVESKEKLVKLNEKSIGLEKENAVLGKEIEEQEKLKVDIVKLDTCPLCKNKITKSHITEVITDANGKISGFNKKLEENEKQRQSIFKTISNLKQNIFESEEKLKLIGTDLIKLNSADEKKIQMLKISESQKVEELNLKQINTRLHELRKEFEKLKNVEEEYDSIRLSLNELSFADMDVDSEVAMKTRELNRIKMELKVSLRDTEDSSEELKKIVKDLEEREREIGEKEKQEQELYEKFQKFFNEKNTLQDEQKALETDVIGFEHTIKSKEERINDININKARINAEIETQKFEFREFEGLELYSMPMENIREKLQNAQERLGRIGSVNLRALDVYDQIKEQCNIIEKKVETIENEKQQILKIILEIDKKKKKAFLITLEAVNKYFTRNFSQLSRKGEVFLDLENKKEPFEGGLNIIVKVARGKYFDITSLSGGEKTLVALSLIFAIQEYKPYSFYIFDEIDAALDKHNSELLAALVKKYMLSGQYIIITHNDALISEASTLYGVSMQDNISKVISLKI